MMTSELSSLGSQITTPTGEYLKSTAVRVLLVEDDLADAARVRETLGVSSSVAFRIEQAASVERALCRLQEGGIDVVLLDLSLPEGSGLDILVRARIATSSVPIIVMTTEGSGDLAVQALRFGAQDYLVKGAWEESFLARTIRHAIERHRMMTALNDARQHEHFLANHDELTGLANRAAFHHQLIRSLATADRHNRLVALLYLDLDRFKEINDTLGHVVGDELLKQIGERLRGIARRSDMVARLGGDEFIVMLHDIQHPRDASVVADAIVQKLAQPSFLAGSEHRVTTSIGIAVYPHDGKNSTDLIRNADAAMYRAKHLGRCQYHYFSDSMNAEVAATRTLGSRFRDAFDGDQILLQFQPQLDVERGRLVGAEVILLWQCPEREALGTDSLIALAEDLGETWRVSEWTLRRSCEHAARWRSGGMSPVGITVKVPRDQIRDDGFVEMVESVLRETHLGGNLLEIEISESVLMNEAPIVIHVLRALRELDVRIAIGNFGLGNSSLSALKGLPIDAIKIDRSFVRHIEEDSADRTIAEVIMTVARGLHLGTVADGVETTSQMRTLYGLGCHHMQGDVFGKPISSEEFAIALARGSAPWFKSVKPWL